MTCEGKVRSTTSDSVRPTDPGSNDGHCKLANQAVSVGYLPTTSCLALKMPGGWVVGIAPVDTLDERAEAGPRAEAKRALSGRTAPAPTSPSAG
jgi:hypothetical protein